MGEITEIKQNERYKEAFAAIVTSIGSDDRKDAAVELGLSRETISRYLNGQVKSVETADKILVFFSERIATRTRNIVKTFSGAI